MPPSVCLRRRCGLDVSSLLRSRHATRTALCLSPHLAYRSVISHYRLFSHSSFDGSRCWQRSPIFTRHIAEMIKLIEKQTIIPIIVDYPYSEVERSNNYLVRRQRARWYAIRRQQCATCRAAACAVIECSTTQNSNEFNKERVTIRFDNKWPVIISGNIVTDACTCAKNPCSRARCTRACLRTTIRDRDTDYHPPSNHFLSLCVDVLHANNESAFYLATLFIATIWIGLVHDFATLRELTTTTVPFRQFFLGDFSTNFIIACSSILEKLPYVSRKLSWRKLL